MNGETAMNGKRRILVVDDDPAVRAYVRAALEHAGYDVTTARDGYEAISRIAASDYDVVLLDVTLPRLDGVEVVEHFSKENNPVLAHTYLLTPASPQEYGELPVCGVIGKPFDIRALLAEAKDCIGH
ncbi:MAG TPA: response regulator [Thermoanaerobaculia bacterium]|nr:response regulator [Thermoanaerobaculia bacterium]